MQLNYWSYELEFRHPFTISKGTKTHQSTLITSLEHRGFTGYGEAPAISYYNIPVEKMIADIVQKKQFIEKFSLTDPERYWHYLHHLIPQNSFLVCALDIAAWDLFGKIVNRPLYQLWNGKPGNAPPTDYTIGIDSIPKMIEKMEERPWPIYKIKVGTADDIAIVRALREKTDAVLRVDANAAWDLETARSLIPQLKELGVQLVEQPLAKDNWEGMKILYAESSIPLIADESCVSEHDVEKCHGHFHGINIKLTKCSGITPAKRMIEEARKKEMKVMLGCMNESTIGSAAMAHLSPFVDYLDADGPLLLKQDVATGLTYQNGIVNIPAGPGLGIEFTSLYDK